MEPISGMISGVVHSPSTVAGAKETPKVQRPENEAKGRPAVPIRDEYIPEEKQEPSGRYWLGKDEDGQPKVYFDDPERAADAAQKQDELPNEDAPEKDEGADGPQKKASSDKVESCNTDAVDREIEKLKKKQEELKRQINSETDDTKIKELEKKLAQVEQELRQKDNDAYRRQHAKYTTYS